MRGFVVAGGFGRRGVSFRTVLDPGEDRGEALTKWDLIPHSMILALEAWDGRNANAPDDRPPRPGRKPAGPAAGGRRTGRLGDQGRASWPVPDRRRHHLDPAGRGRRRDLLRRRPAAGHPGHPGPGGLQRRQAAGLRQSRERLFAPPEGRALGRAGSDRAHGPAGQGGRHASDHQLPLQRRLGRSAKAGQAGGLGGAGAPGPGRGGAGPYPPGAGRARQGRRARRHGDHRQRDQPSACCGPTAACPPPRRPAIPPPTPSICTSRALAAGTRWPSC